MTTMAARGIFAITVTICIGLVVFGKMLLGLFGAEFTTGYVVLLILLAGQVINAMAGSVGYLMTMTGYQNQAAWIIGMSTLVNVGLNAVLIPKLGIVGAAIATATTTVLWNILMLTFVWRKLNINPTVFARI